MYADRMTDSMRIAIDETNRRRANPDATTTRSTASRRRASQRRSATSRTGCARSPRSKPRIRPPGSLPKDELLRLVRELETQMKKAARDLEFEKAACCATRSSSFAANWLVRRRKDSVSSSVIQRPVGRPDPLCRLGAEGDLGTDVRDAGCGGKSRPFVVVPDYSTAHADRPRDTGACLVSRASAEGRTLPSMRPAGSLPRGARARVTGTGTKALVVPQAGTEAGNESSWLSNGGFLPSAATTLYLCFQYPLPTQAGTAGSTVTTQPHHPRNSLPLLKAHALSMMHLYTQAHRISSSLIRAIGVAVPSSISRGSSVSRWTTSREPLGPSGGPTMPRSSSSSMMRAARG